MADKKQNNPDKNIAEIKAEELAELNPEEVAKAEILGDFTEEKEGKDEKTDYGIVRGRVLENEMRESYLDYAMSVIISRALPDVRDGLKPVHRRVLFSMNELGLTHQAKYRKSATVVGDVLGKYHPHGDIAVYDTLVRLAQDFSMGVRLVDGQGNFGSVDGDQAAAMRYCVTGDTLIITDKGLTPIKDISSDGREDIKRKILSKNQKINSAIKWFDSGTHPTIKISTLKGYTLQGSYNHPILVWNGNRSTGTPGLQWKLLSQIKLGDVAVINRTPDLLWPKRKVQLKLYWPKAENSRARKKVLPKILNQDLAYIVGSLLSEGTLSQNELEFCNTDKQWINNFKRRWFRVFPDCRLHEFKKRPSSFGKKSYYTLEIHSRYVLRFLQNIGLKPCKSADRLVPWSIFQSPKSVVSIFLSAYFEGDGTISSSGRMVELSCISKNNEILRQIQILLLRFGVASTRRLDHYRSIYKLYVRGLDNYRIFNHEINFLGKIKKDKLKVVIQGLKKVQSQTDFVPLLSDYTRSNLNESLSYHDVRQFVVKHNFDRYPQMQENYQAVASAVKVTVQPYLKNIFKTLLSNHYLFDPITKISDGGRAQVYSLKVESECHSYVGNGFINHNTECRLTAPAEELLSDIEKDTVDFVPNYDSTREEPKVLPAKLPNLLLNGSMGIAVGMATNIPPHNLGEVCDAAIYLIDNLDCTIDDLMTFVKGPDFPTGAEIYGLAQIKNAYGAGKGAIVMRAVANIEETKRGFRIIVTEIPYQVNKAELILKIADLVKEKKLDGISDLRDESDRKDGVRIVIELRANAYPKKILNRLYELTTMQTIFYVNMLALVDGIQPRVLTLKNILEEYIKHRQVVVRRRTQFELDRAKERAHILEGLRIALKNIDEVVATIRKSTNRDEAQKKLVTKFKLDEVQANAILEMRLSALAALEREKVETEYQEKIKLITSLEAILASGQKILEIIKKELTDLKNKFPSPRRTKIYAQEIGKFSAEDLIPSEQVIIILTRGNYIKRMPAAAYKSQVRGGKGVMGMETREEDMIEHLIIANTHDDIYFFTDRGRVFHTKVYEIPAASRLAKGQAVVNILQISPEEKVTSMICLSTKDIEKFKFIMMATTKGSVKKTTLSMYSKVRKTGILAMKLKGDDRLRWVKFTKGNSKIFQVSARGQSILYEETDIRPMGRTAAGVRGIALRANDYVVSTDVVSPEREKDADALIVLEKGFGKRTPLPQFKTQIRGGMGIRAANVTERTGPIVGMRLVYGEDYDVILASSKGQVIRMSLFSIKELQRDTQGVTLIKLNSGDKVTSVTVIKKDMTDKLDLPSEPNTGGDLDDVKSDKDNEVPAIKISEEAKVGEEVEEQIKEKPAGEKGSKKSSPVAQNAKSKSEEKEKKIPDWAKVHADSWRQPQIFKNRKDIKVNDYSKKDESPKGNPNKTIDQNLPNLFKKKSEPNYWGREG